MAGRPLVYTHETVIHDTNFVNPDNPDIHTQNIENMWMRVKRKLRYLQNISFSILVLNKLNSVV
jgi:hypothetical protein